MLGGWLFQARNMGTGARVHQVVGRVSLVDRRRS